MPTNSTAAYFRCDLTRRWLPVTYCEHPGRCGRDGRAPVRRRCRHHRKRRL